MPRRKKTEDLTTDTDEGLSLDGGGNWPFSKTAAGIFEAWRNHPEKEAFSCYIYRLWPVIDRKAGKAAAAGRGYKYIDKVIYPAPLDEETVKVQWGSGKYRLDLFNALAGANGARIGTAKMDIQDSDFPPVFALDELIVGHPDNASIVERLRVRGELPGGEGDKTMANDTAAAAAVQQLGSSLREVLQERKAGAGEVETLGRVADVVAKLVPRPVDPLDQAKQLKELMGGGVDMAVILKTMLETQAKLTQVMLERSAPATAAASNPVDELDRTLSLVEKLQSFNGGGGSSWVSDLVKALPVLAPVLMAVFASRPAAAVPVAALPAGAGAPAPAPVVPAVPAVPANDPAIEGIENMLGGIKFARLLDVGNKAMRAFERGMEGDAFADALVQLEDDGAAIYTALAGLGVDGLMAVLATLPAWSKLQAQEARVRAWLGEFIAYGQGDTEGDV